METISLKNSSYIVRFSILIAVCMLFMLLPLVAVYAGGGGSGGGGGGGSSSSGGGSGGGGGGSGISYPPPSLTSDASNNFDWVGYMADQKAEYDGDTGPGGYQGESPQAESVMDFFADSMYSNVDYDLVQFPAGNVSVTVGSPCSNCTLLSRSVDNGNGTHSTVNVYIQRDGSITPTGHSSSGGSISTCPVGETLLSNGWCGTIITCPNGETRQADGKCYSPHQCENAHSGGKNGGSGAWNLQCCPMGTAVQVAGGGCSGILRTCPAGEVAYPDDTCQPSSSPQCPAGTVLQSDGTCAVPPPPPPITGITITATPSVVRYGNTSTLIWNIGNADSCTVSGPLLPATSITVTKNGSTAISNIESQSTYTLNCVLGPKGNQSTGSASTTIQVLPSVQET